MSPHTSIAERAGWCTRGSRWSPPSTTRRAAGRSGSGGSASSRSASCSVLYRGAQAPAGEAGGDQGCQGRDVCQCPVQQVRQRGRAEAGNWVSHPLWANTGHKDELQQIIDCCISVTSSTLLTCPASPASSNNFAACLPPVSPHRASGPANVQPLPALIIVD